MIHMNMEAKKSNDLLSVGWRHKRANDVVRRAENQIADGIDSSPSLKVSEPEHPCTRRLIPKLQQSEFKIYYPLPLLFYLGLQ